MKARRGLTLLEVVIAVSLLSLIMLAIATTTASTAGAIDDTSLMARANAAAKAEMELFLNAPFSNLNAFYTTFRQTNPSMPVPPHSPAPYPKVSAAFTVRGPGLPPTNNYGTVVVREPLPTEAPAYRKGLGPKFPYANPTNPNAGVSSTPSSFTEVKLYLIIVEVNIPAGPGRRACSVRLQTLRFALTNA